MFQAEQNVDAFLHLHVIVLSTNESILKTLMQAYSTDLCKWFEEAGPTTLHARAVDLPPCLGMQWHPAFFMLFSS